MPKDNDTGRFTVHVYTISDTEEFFYTSGICAVLDAKRFFKRSDVYKVKVWDSELGPIEPNIVNPPGLLLQLV